MWSLLACSSEVPPPPERVVQGPPAVRAAVDAREVRLEAATRRLTGRTPEVRLVGMVHVGDPAYYAAVDAFLAPCARVLYEGLDADQGELPDDADVADSLAAAGLVFQRDALATDDRWVRTDGSVSEVRAALSARPDLDPAVVDTWLVDRDRDALREVLGAARQSERLRGVVRMSLVRGLAAPPPREDAWWDVVIGARDVRVVDAVLASPVGPACVVYGADHLPDLEARLVRRGWAVTERGALPVVSVLLAELGLGPVQVRQFLERR
jgi:hypothetical protein